MKMGREESAGDCEVIATGNSREEVAIVIVVGRDVLFHNDLDVHVLCAR